MAHIAFKADDKFEENLNWFVIECRRENPEKNTTRSAVIRDVVEQAILMYRAGRLPKIRTRK